MNRMYEAANQYTLKLVAVFAAITALVGVLIVAGCGAAFLVGLMGPHEPGTVMGPRAFEIVAEWASFKKLATGIFIIAVGLGILFAAANKAESE